MTSPASVGEVSVEIVGDMRDLAKEIRKRTEEALKDSKLGDKIRDSVGKDPIKVPVTPDLDPDGIPEQTKKSKIPPVKVPVDPLMQAFVAEVKRQTNALAKQVNAQLPIGADTSELRNELGDELKAIAATVRAEIPVEPESKEQFQRDLQAQLDEVSARLKASVRVDADTSQVPAEVAATPIPDVEVDVEPDTGAFEPKLRAAVASAAARIRQTVRVDVDVDRGGSGGNRIGATLQSALGAAGALGGALSAAVSSAGGLAASLGPVVGILAAISAAATLLAPALAAAAGAAAAIPAALSGVGAAVGTLALGFSGIADAFKPSTGGGGGGAAGQAANQARQIAAASRQVEAARRGIVAANRQVQASERALAAALRGQVAAQRTYRNSLDEVAQAQERARRSQDAVSRARRQAREDIEDLNRSLRGAVLSEAEAANALDEAALALDQARTTGDLRKIREAELAYERAKLQVEETADATQDLRAETAEANAKGVEGSDLVQDALRDQAEAYQAVADAQEGVLAAQDGLKDAADAVKSAQDGVASALDGAKAAADALASANESLAAAQTKVASGGGGVAKQVTKLAPAAQAFVDAIKRLKPAFEALRLDVQQRLFAGLDKTVTHMWNSWEKQLHVTLGSFADTFNQFAKNLGSAVSTPTFISGIAAGAEGFRQALEKIGTALTSKLVPVFGELSRAAGPFLSQLGDELAEIVTRFSDWVLQGEKTGGLTRFFDRAAAAMRDIFDIGGEVAEIIGSLFEVITGKNTSTNKTPLESFKASLATVSDWLKDPQNQQRLREIIERFKEFIPQALEWGRKLKDLAGDIADAIGKARGVIAELKQIKSDITAIIRSPVDATFDILDWLGLGGEVSLDQSLASVGEDLVNGLFAGIGQALVREANRIAGWFWSGPDSLIGRIKSGLGIASPSTVMMAVGVDLIQGLIEGVTQRLGALAAKAREIPGIVRNNVVGAGSWLVQKGRDAVTGAATGLRERFSQLRTTAGQIRTNVINALPNAGTWLVNVGRNAVTGVGTGIARMAGPLRSWAGQIRTWVQGALSNAHTWLTSAGVNAVIGLWNGIVSKGGWLWDRVVNFARTYVKQALENALIIFSPSKLTFGMGQYVAQGLALGIEDEGARVKAAADELAAFAVPDVSSTFGLGSDFDASVSRSLSVAENRQLVAKWAPGARGDRLLDALRDLIAFEYRNDPIAALTPAR
ncbi:hypothetical protein Ade02nite_19820 [Paractinoplanes deccanensis]|uniref:Tape measure protein n=1 Tax=Paractinoplanes deccanensis TaxID=113561 RepID=A0ABQ3Y007_9ACTN|nr:hypothetical protein [Actinoplanes deccanensis]GID73341.1 hypothetical protein Ade02nite_19820 [Actinoplanes deccanensis]